MSDHPVEVDVASPAHFDRMQLLVRLAVAFVLGWFGITAGWLAGMLYFLLPLVAVIAIGAIGSVRYVEEFAPRMWRPLAWLLQLSAYMMLLVDRIPVTETGDVNVRARFTGRPTIGSAVVRLATSFPSAFALMLLSIVSGVLCLVSYIVVLAGAAVPHGVLAYQRAMLRWQARLLAYHASFVEEYPPFALDTDVGSSAPLATAGVP